MLTAVRMVSGGVLVLVAVVLFISDYDALGVAALIVGVIAVRPAIVGLGRTGTYPRERSRGDGSGGGGGWDSDGGGDGGGGGGGGDGGGGG